MDHQNSYFYFFEPGLARRFFLTAFLLFAFQQTAFAESTEPRTQSVHIVLDLAAPTPSQAEPLSVELEATPIEGTDSGPVSASNSGSDLTVRTTSQVPGSADLALPLPTESWLIQLQSDRLWAPAATWSSDVGTAPVRLDVLPAGSVAATVVLDNPQDTFPSALFAQLRIRPQRKKAEEEAKEPRPFEVECPIDPESKIVECTLPAKVLDLKLTAAGFTPIYHWDLEIERDQRRTLEVIRLVPGSSIAGWAFLEDGQPAAGADVSLEPVLGSKRMRPELAARVAQRQTKTTTNQRGFFQLAGLEAGAFRLSLLLAEYGLTEIPLLRLVGRDEVAIDDPLVIPKFPQAEIVVRPPTDPDGSPWTLFVGTLRETTVIAETDDQGVARLAMLRPDTYQVIVMSASGEAFATEHFPIDGSNSHHEIEIDFISVVGRLELGGEAVSGLLYFGGRHGLESIRLEADEEGRFLGQLPRAGEWAVDVVSRHPPIERRLGRVEVVVGDDGIGRVEIDLPAATIEGRVVDGDGRGISEATVLILPLSEGEKPPAPKTDQDGVFGLTGLPIGRYRLQALKGTEKGLVSSARMELEIKDEDAQAEVELTLLEAVVQTGQVVTYGGQAIPGAIVRALLPEGMSIIVPEDVTGIEGDFALSLVPGVEEIRVLVMAPGYELLDATRHYGGVGSPWRFAVRANGGGTLRLAADRAFGHGYIERIDATTRRYTIPLLNGWAVANGYPSYRGDGVLEVPGMPAGTYRFCLAQTSEGAFDCDRGFLSEGAHVTLYGKTND